MNRKDSRSTGQERKKCLLRKAWTWRKRKQEVSPTYVQDLVVGLVRQDQNTVPRHDTDLRPCREQDNCLNRTQIIVPVRTFSYFFLLTSLLFSASIFILFHFHFRILNSPSMFRCDLSALVLRNVRYSFFNLITLRIKGTV
jgi:hypothetical protein